MSQRSVRLFEKAKSKNESFVGEIQIDSWFSGRCHRIEWLLRVAVTIFFQSNSAPFAMRSNIRKVKSLQKASTHKKHFKKKNKQE